jgi:hypothetical protein
VGTYPITDVLGGPAAANYTVTVVPGTLTITKATGPLTVTVNNATRLYGAANPAFTSTVAGALNGDTFIITYATTATAASPVGNYAIVPTVSGAAAANYSIITNNGTLTITAAPLTVAANNASRAYGAANPTFTSTVTGLVNGDSVTVSYATTATATSAPGTYPITATVTGAALANYTLNVTPGTLTVAPAATSVTLATSASPVFIGASITFTATVSSAAGVPPGTVSFLNGTALLGTGTINASGVATFSTSSLTPGTYTITATYPGSADFVSSSGTVTEVVNPGSFTVSANPPDQFVRGPGTTTFTITVTSMQGFSGAVVLSCSGLPADATCAFSNQTLNLTANGTATASMVLVNTAADAQLRMPGTPTPKNGDGMSGEGQNSSRGLAPIAIAAVFPFELTGLGVIFAGWLRRRQPRSGSGPGQRPEPEPEPQNLIPCSCLRQLRLLLVLACTSGLIGLAGCNCFTSVYHNYTITITGTNPTVGSAPQSTTVVLSVGQQ